MPAVKRRYYIIIIVLLLPLAAWSARLYLAELLLTSPMKHAGLEKVIADIHRLGLNQTQLSRLSFVLPDKPDTLTLDARDITIDYQPGKLISGHIDSLEINTLVANYEFSDEPATADNEKQLRVAPGTQPSLQPLLILGMLRNALDKYLFFNDLVIHHLILNGKPFSVLDGKSLSLTMNTNSSKKEDGLYAELTMLDKAIVSTSDDRSAGSPQLVISRLSKDELVAKLRLAHDASNKDASNKDTSNKHAVNQHAENQQLGDLPARISLSLQETEISGSYQFSPENMQAWLQEVYGNSYFAASEIHSSELNGTLSLNFENEDILKATVTSSVKRLSFDKYSTENIALDIRFNYSRLAASHKLKLSDGSYLRAGRLDTGVAAFSDSRINLNGELTSTDENWKYRGRLSSELLSVSYQSQNQSQLLKLADIDTAISADAHELLAEGSFSPATLPGKFSFSFAHDLDSRMGSVSINPVAGIDLSAEDDRISKLLTPWPYPFDLYTGNIKLDAQAAWSRDEETRLSTGVSLQHTGGNIDAIVFSGLTFDHKLEILPVMESVHASELKLNTVDSGVTLSNIRMQLAAKVSARGTLPRIIVRQTHGEILGGTFTADDMVYDLNRSKNSFFIRVKDIDLAEVVKTQQLDNITATGRLDGNLPVEITRNGLNIAHGGLSNQVRGGTIRYIPKSGTEQLKQNPITGIALDALRDFRYSELQADVNYLPDGELTINLELKGISPELDKNRPVHLNINTEQNLVSLLKSLRFAQGVSDSIDVQVRKIYERSSNINN
jgi:hypothetical protein